MPALPEAPAASVIVPTRDRPEHLAGCLRALAALEPPDGGFETIVVDDEGAQPLDDLVAAGANGLDVRLIRVPNGGPAAARNAGIAVARGNVLAFTDDDCRPRPGWLRALVLRIQDSPEALVGGRTVMGTGGVSAETSQLIAHLVYAHYNQVAGRALFLASNNLAARADALRAAGAFDPAFRTSEDRDLSDRWRFSGASLVYAPEAVVEHEPDLSPARFAAQHFGYGRGAYRYHQARARRGSGRLRDHVGFHADLPRLLRQELSHLPRRRLPAVAGLLVLWQAANLAGFAWEATAERGRRGRRGRAVTGPPPNDVSA